MASINNDIRARSRSNGRTIATIGGVALLALVLSFVFSFLPGFVSAHTATTLPDYEEVDQPIYVTVQADVEPGETVQAIAWAWGDFGVQPTSLSCANSGIFVPFTNTLGVATTTNYGQLEFYANAPHTPGNYSFFYQISTSTSDCTGIVLPLIENDHALDAVPVKTTSSQTVVVRAADLAADIAAVIATPTKWFFYNDENDTIDNSLGGFVWGPATAPIGSGSAEMTVSGTQRRNIATYQFAGIPLSQITALSFSTYSQATTSTTKAPYLHFNVDFTGANTWQGRLVYVPATNGSITENTWQNWNTMGTGMWTWSKFASNGNKWPDNNTNPNRSWNDILAAFPNIQTRATDSWLGIRVGEPYVDGFTGNIDNFVITIDNGINATTTTFDFEATDPVCASGQHLDNHVCVADPVSTGSGNGGGNGGGGGAPVSGPLSIGFVNTNNGGQVLGASTELPAGCSAYLTSYLKKGSTNSSEVKKLQTFLNGNLGLTLPVTGIFGPLTFNAVSAFQVKYADEILKPWFEKGLSKDMNPSGYAYKMTNYKINLLQCASLNTPVPQLP